MSDLPDFDSPVEEEAPASSGDLPNFDAPLPASEGTGDADRGYTAGTLPSFDAPSGETSPAPQAPVYSPPAGALPNFDNAPPEPIGLEAPQPAGDNDAYDRTIDTLVQLGEMSPEEADYRKWSRQNNGVDILSTSAGQPREAVFEDDGSYRARAGAPVGPPVGPEASDEAITDSFTRYRDDAQERFDQYAEDPRAQRDVYYGDALERFRDTIFGANTDTGNPVGDLVTNTVGRAAGGLFNALGIPQELNERRLTTEDLLAERGAPGINLDPIAYLRDAARAKAAEAGTPEWLRSYLTTGAAVSELLPNPMNPLAQLTGTRFTLATPEQRQAAYRDAQLLDPASRRGMDPASFGGAGFNIARAINTDPLTVPGMIAPGQAAAFLRGAKTPQAVKAGEALYQAATSGTKIPPLKTFFERAIDGLNSAQAFPAKVISLDFEKVPNWLHLSQPAVGLGFVGAPLVINTNNPIGTWVQNEIKNGALAQISHYDPAAANMLATVGTAFATGAAAAIGFRVGGLGGAAILKALPSRLTATQALIRNTRTVVDARGRVVRELKPGEPYTLKTGEKLAYAGSTASIPRTLDATARAGQLAHGVEDVNQFARNLGEIGVGVKDINAFGKDALVRVVQHGEFRSVGELEAALAGVPYESLVRNENYVKGDRTQGTKQFTVERAIDVPPGMLNEQDVAGANVIVRTVRDFLAADRVPITSDTLKTFIEGKYAAKSSDAATLLSTIADEASFRLAKDFSLGRPELINPLFTFRHAVGELSSRPELRDQILASGDQRLRDFVDPASDTGYKALIKEAENIGLTDVVGREAFLAKMDGINRQIIAAMKKAGIDQKQLTAYDYRLTQPKVNAVMEVMTDFKGFLSPFWLTMRPQYYVNNMVGNLFSIFVTTGLWGPATITRQGLWLEQGRRDLINNLVGEQGAYDRLKPSWVGGNQPSEISHRLNQPGITEWLTRKLPRALTAGPRAVAGAVDLPGKGITKTSEKVLDTPFTHVFSEGYWRELAWTLHATDQAKTKMYEQAYTIAVARGASPAAAAQAAREWMNLTASGKYSPTMADHWIGKVNWERSFGKEADFYRNNAVDKTPEQFLDWVKQHHEDKVANFQQGPAPVSTALSQWTRDSLRQQAIDAYAPQGSLPSAVARVTEWVDAAFAVADARAKVWADRQNAAGHGPFAPEDYYTERFSGIIHENKRTTADRRANGSTTFIDDNQALIRIFDTADASTLVHEFAHVFRHDLEDFELRAFERELKVDNGIWDVTAEEKFARGFEMYVKSGQAPTPVLQKVFDQFKQWLDSIYAAVKNMNRAVPQSARDWFDEILTGNIPPAAAANAAPVTPIAPNVAPAARAAQNPNVARRPGPAAPVTPVAPITPVTPVVPIAPTQSAGTASANPGGLNVSAVVTPQAPRPGRTQRPTPQQAVANAAAKLGITPEELAGRKRAQYDEGERGLKLLDEILDGKLQYRDPVTGKPAISRSDWKAVERAAAVVLKADPTVWAAPNFPPELKSGWTNRLLVMSEPELRAYLDDMMGKAEDAEAAGRPHAYFDQQAMFANRELRLRYAEGESHVLYQPQIRENERPALMRWFGRGAAVDANGEPMRLYHGTQKPGFETLDFSQFDPDGLYGPGFYMTDTPEIAGGRFNERGSRIEEGYASKGAPRLSNVMDPGKNVLAARQVVSLPQFRDLETRARASGDAGDVSLSDGRSVPVWSIMEDLSALRDMAEGKADWISASSIQPFIRLKDNYGIPTTDILDRLGVQTAVNEGGVHPVFTNIQRPFDIDAPLAEATDVALQGALHESLLELLEIKLRNETGGRLAGASNGDLYRALDSLFRDDKPAVNRLLQKLGFDGITHIGGRNTGGQDHRVYIAFAPEQVKSATGNRGTYDPSDANMLHQDAPTRTPQQIQQDIARLEMAIEDEIAAGRTYRDFPELLDRLNDHVADLRRVQADAPRLMDDDVTDLILEEFGMAQANTGHLPSNLRVLEEQARKAILAAEDLVAALPSLPPGTVPDITKWLSPRDLRNIQKAAWTAASQAGELAAKNTVFSYTDRNYFQYLLDHFTPYSYWYMQHIAQLGKAFAKNPAEYAMFIYLANKWMEDPDDRAPGSRWNAKLMTLPDGRQVWFRPQVLSPMAGGTLLDIVDPDDQLYKEKVSPWLQWTDALGLNFHLPIQLFADWQQTQGNHNPLAKDTLNSFRGQDTLSINTLIRKMSGGTIDVEKKLREVIFGTGELHGENRAAALELFRRVEMERDPAKQRELARVAKQAILDHKEGKDNKDWNDARAVALRGEGFLPTGGLAFSAFLRYMGAPIIDRSAEDHKYRELMASVFGGYGEEKKQVGDGVMGEFFKNHPSASLVSAAGEAKTPQQLRKDMATEEYYARLEEITARFTLDQQRISREWLEDGKITGTNWRDQDKYLSTQKAAEIKALKNEVFAKYGVTGLNSGSDSDADKGFTASGGRPTGDPLDLGDAWDKYNQLRSAEYGKDEPDFKALASKEAAFFKEMDKKVIFIDGTPTTYSDAIRGLIDKNKTPADALYEREIIPVFIKLGEIPKYKDSPTAETAAQRDKILKAYSDARYGGPQELTHQAGVNAVIKAGFSLLQFESAQQAKNPARDKFYDSKEWKTLQEKYYGEKPDPNKPAVSKGSPTGMSAQGRPTGSASSGRTTVRSTSSLTSVDGRTKLDNDGFWAQYDKLRDDGKSAEAAYLRALNWDSLKAAGYKLNGEKPDVNQAKLKWDRSLLYDAMPDKGPARDAWLAQGNGKKLNDLSRALGEKPIWPEISTAQLAAKNERDRIYDYAYQKLSGTERTNYLKANQSRLDSLARIIDPTGKTVATGPTSTTRPASGGGAPRGGGGGGGGGGGSRPAGKPSTPPLEASFFATDAGPELMTVLRGWKSGQVQLSDTVKGLLKKLRARYPFDIPASQPDEIWLAALHARIS